MSKAESQKGPGSILRPAFLDLLDYGKFSARAGQGKGMKIKTKFLTMS